MDPSSSLSSSPLAVTSRHNRRSQQTHIRSLFLGDSDLEFDSDSDADGDVETCFGHSLVEIDSEEHHRAKRLRTGPQLCGVSTFSAFPPSSPPTPSSSSSQSSIPGHNSQPKVGKKLSKVPTTPTRGAGKENFLVKGTVTPSRADAFFLRRSKIRKGNPDPKSDPFSAPTSSSPIVKADKGDHLVKTLHSNGLATPPPSSPVAFSSTPSPSSSSLSQTKCQSLSPGNTHISPSKRSYLLSSPPKSTSFLPPLPLAVRHLVSGGPSQRISDPSSVQDRLWNMRTRTSMYGDRIGTISYRPRINLNPHFETFVSLPRDVYRLPLATSRVAGEQGGDAESESYAYPFCSSYSYSSRSVNPSAQWLAVGDDQGRISILNTLQNQDPSAESYFSHPVWSVTPEDCPGSIFEVSWRFDDRVILSGSSDYLVKSWDVEYQKPLDVFQGHRGSPRVIVWDPTTSGDGCGNIFASAGRDGAIHLWDTRVSQRSPRWRDEAGMGERLSSYQDEGEGTSGGNGEASTESKRPVLSLWSAHTSVTANGNSSRRSRNAASNNRSGPNTDANGPMGRRRKGLAQPKGVTALSYLQDGVGHRLISGGCENAVLKCWDLRNWSSGSGSKSDAGSRAGKGGQAFEEVDVPSRGSDQEPTKRKKVAAGKGKTFSSPSARWDPMLSRPEPIGTSWDLSMSDDFNRRPHGISSMVTTRDRVFTSCTDGRIYPLPLTRLTQGAASTQESCDQTISHSLETLTPLFDSVQKQNTLYTKLAILDDRFLAMGCNTGQAVVWDVENPIRLRALEEEEEHDQEEEIEYRMAQETGCGVAIPSRGSQKKRNKNTGLGPHRNDLRPVILTGGHVKNCEINSVSWANGPFGPTLATVGDDAVIRTWCSDRLARSHFSSSSS
ncbi:WD40 repeat-like protein [Violaceomyces palustris]|uniref:WD40 repeat-like protein n=1 Tax=Violaceomyces palustris TaxID=1673888 RepID=A0ACD0NSN3_9BASI|nr:WD40 repeat-like protein [Violaceomyces palustris]